MRTSRQRIPHWGHLSLPCCCCFADPPSLSPPPPLRVPPLLPPPSPAILPPPVVGASPAQPPPTVVSTTPASSSPVTHVARLLYYTLPRQRAINVKYTDRIIIKINRYHHDAICILFSPSIDFYLFSDITKLDDNPIQFFRSWNKINFILVFLREISIIIYFS